MKIKMLSKNTKYCSHITGFIFGIALQNYLSLLSWGFTWKSWAHQRDHRCLHCLPNWRNNLSRLVEDSVSPVDQRLKQKTQYFLLQMIYCSGLQIFWTCMSCECEYLISFTLVYCRYKYMVETEWNVSLFKRSWRRKTCLTVHSG